MRTAVELQNPYIVCVANERGERRKAGQKAVWSTARRRGEEADELAVIAIVPRTRQRAQTQTAQTVRETVSQSKLRSVSSE